MPTYLNLVATRIDVSESDAFTLGELQERWPEFLSVEDGDARAPESAAVDYSLRAVGSSVPHPYKGGPNVTVTRSGDRWDIVRGDFVGSWDAATRRAEVRYMSQLSSFSSFLRILLSITLREHGGALFHAASIAVKGAVKGAAGGSGGEEALLFPGVSGTGKSTISALALPRGILSDELSGLRAHAGRIWAFPTPFWGDIARERAADAAPLRGIVLLSRAGSTSLSRASKAEAFAALLEGGLFFDQGELLEEKRNFTSSLQKFAEAVPCSRLRFDLPSNPWPLLDP